ncbi:MAG: hypothetical protein A2X64_10280 [Ignavibacteria bacterium GWF2_33_9]|nr:MAG: hypothetical protein A2X64_10280 [Ignavibacteria bacterium GWF2_33_9]
MKIKSLKISNWRSINYIELDLQNLMIFIGQNNHGKSNVLSSLLFFFGELNCNDLDYKDGTDELYVEIEFENLDDIDKSTFKKYLTADNHIKVRKSATKGNKVEYHGYLEIATEEWLKDGAEKQFTDLKSAKELPLGHYLPDSGKLTQKAYKEARDKYIEENRNEINFQYQLENDPFLGLTNVASGIFGDVFYIPSVKDANSELKLGTNSSSIFNKLYSRVINQISESNPDYKEAKDKMSALMKILNKETVEGTKNEQRPEELNVLESSIADELKSWQTTIDIEITPPNIDDIFKVGASVWINDGIKTDITRKGHGLQRAVIFALVKSWAKLLMNEKQKQEETSENTEAEDNTKKSKRKSSSSVYFIIEEPELYLHPQAQRELFSTLVDLSKTDNQVLLCTHSSSFINLENYKSICIIKKDNQEEGTKVFQYLDELFIDPEIIKQFNLSYWVNPDRSELFFATKVILVEGQTEKIILPFLAKKLLIHKFDYSIIDCESKDKMIPYIELLNKFKIKYITVYDLDHQTGKSLDAINCADKSSTLINSKIDSSLGQYIIFENDIEEEIGITEKDNKNKPYKALTTVNDDAFNISDSLKEKIKKIFE